MRNLLRDLYLGNIAPAERQRGRAGLRRSKLHIPRFRLRRKLAHFAAPPPQIETAALGFDLAAVQTAGRFLQRRGSAVQG